jgi:hypothetical protein
MKIINLVLLSVVIFISYGFTFSSSKKTISYVSIEELINKKALDVSISGSGGHQEECIEFEIANLTDSTIYMKIEPGRRLVSEDTTLQDIFIVKEFLLELFAFEKIKIKGYGFCCQAGNSSPYAKAKFDIGFMAPATWIKLAEIINENNFPVSAIQNAIWVLSDNHPFSSVYDKDLALIQPLKTTLAEILKVEIPWYSLTYIKDTTRLFSDRPEKIYGEIEYYVANNCLITINIRNSNGEVVKTLVKECFTNPGTYKYYLEQNVSCYPKGEYEVYVYEDLAKLKFKKKFEL